MGWAASRNHRPLDAEACRALARALGDTPETVISVHLLNRGLCRAYVAGDPECFDAAVIQDNSDPGELMGFGADPEALWELLKVVEGWWCVSVSLECAPGLGAIIEERTGSRVRYYGDVYHALTRPVVRFRSEAVRRLMPADLDLLESAPPEIRGAAFGSLRKVLEDGFAAGAIVSGRIVGVAQTYALSERHADIGVFTRREWRRQGYATAAASIVARCVQEAGRTPVWSTGEDNVASLRIAAKLGFQEVLRRTYVILRGFTEML